MHYILGIVLGAKSQKKSCSSFATPYRGTRLSQSESGSAKRVSPCFLGSVKIRRSHWLAGNTIFYLVWGKKTTTFLSLCRVLKWRGKSFLFEDDGLRIIVFQSAPPSPEGTPSTQPPGEVTADQAPGGRTATERTG